ncbi:MAG TPA: ATP-binding protein [Ktedonobacterales bacterium]
MSEFPLSSARRFSRLRRALVRLRQVSTFEKVIVANSVVILLTTIAGWWITQHGPEPYHYLIDTIFIALAALLGMSINFLFLRAAFGPLHSLLLTIHAVQRGDLRARAEARESDTDILALAGAFNAMLDRLEETRYEAAGRVLRAQEEERRRLALELHDQTGQSVTALALHAEAIVQRLKGETNPAALQARFQAERLTLLAQKTLEEVQALSRQLRPPMLDDLGLAAALRWLAEDAGERLGVEVDITMEQSAALPPEGMPDELERLPGDVETALFRIAQESLTNAVRHGQAAHVQIKMCRQGAAIRLFVEDDGTGFEILGGDKPAMSRAGRQGVGLEGMRERAQLLGGALTIHSRKGHGCKVTVNIPLTQPPFAFVQGETDAASLSGNWTAAPFAWHATKDT